MSDDLDSMLGGGKTPPNAKFAKPGDKVIILLTEDGKVLPVKEFVNGKPTGEQMFWQGNKPTRQSQLNIQLPFNEMKQILLVGKTKEGEDVSIWAEGEKLKSLKAGVKESGVQPRAGVMVAMEYTGDDPNGKGAFPKKLYKTQLKAAS